MVPSLVAGLVLIVVFAVTARRRPDVSLGILVGAGAAGTALAVAPPVHITSIPLWLPPLPLALIAITLFFFGFLAWFWGSDR